MTLFVGGSKMKDEELKERLEQIHGKFASLELKRDLNAKAARDWIAMTVQTAFTRLEGQLHQLQRTGTITDISSKPETSTSKPMSELKFTYKQTGTKTPLSYIIELDVSLKGVVGHTKLKAGGEDILKWKEDKIIVDFLSAYGSWQPVK
jgi:hypothetical protein